MNSDWKQLLADTALRAECSKYNATVRLALSGLFIEMADENNLRTAIIVSYDEIESAKFDVIEQAFKRLEADLGFGAPDYTHG